MMNITKVLLPARLPPLPNELFLSWVARLAKENLSEPTSFTQIILPKTNIWSGCINGYSCRAPHKILAKLTGYAEKEIEALYTLSFIEKHYVWLKENYCRNYLIPAKARGFDYKNNWLQFCPKCLHEDELPYYRNHWRIFFLPICVKHLCELHNCCPKCNKPIHFHKLPYHTKSLSHCFNCGFNLSETQFNLIPSNSPLAEYSQRIQAGIDHGWVNINPNIQVMMPLFVAGIWLILKAMLTKKGAAKLREELAIPQIMYKTSFLKQESMKQQDILLLFTAVAQLLHDWPSSFNKKCEDLKLPKVAFHINESQVPFWLYNELNNINKQPYWPSTNEFKAAAYFLLNNNYQITHANIAEAAGLDRSCTRTSERQAIMEEVRSKQINFDKIIFHWYIHSSSNTKVTTFFNFSENASKSES
ncbi:TniQ family protein [Vibrio cholerae]|nr:TniQ family protein [Vibrio cholerae]